MINVVQLKKYVQERMKRIGVHLIQANISFSIHYNGDKVYALKDTDRLLDVISKGFWSHDKLVPNSEPHLGYWNGGKTYNQLREAIYVKITHPMF